MTYGYSETLCGRSKVELPKHGYLGTREEAIVRGNLIDLSEYSKNAGMRWPVGITKDALIDFEIITVQDRKELVEGIAERIRTTMPTTDTILYCYKREGVKDVLFQVVAHDEKRRMFRGSHGWLRNREDMMTLTKAPEIEI